MQTLALIPSYQPDEKLVSLVKELHQRNIVSVVVDDGSGDTYRSVFKALSHTAHVVTCDTNQGKGRALKLGLSYIQAHYPKNSVVVTVDGDGQHAPDDVVRCARKLGPGFEALVLGCRSFYTKGVPIKSRLGNLITCAVYKLASGVDVSDTQTGLRAFPFSLIPFLLSVEGERYEYEMNVLLACPKHHIPIQELPIRTIYTNNNAGSHFRPLRDSACIYKGIVSDVLSSLAQTLTGIQNQVALKTKGA